MEDEKLLKISLISACIGIFALFCILYYSSEKVYSVEELKEVDDNTKITVYGLVKGLRETEKIAQIEIIEYRMIKQESLLFKDNNESVSVSEGERVKIKGEMYDGKLIIEKIEKI